MKRVGGIVLVLAGILVILFGLLFLIGSEGRGYRIAVGLFGLVAGIGVSGIGSRLFTSAGRESPEALRTEIMELARQSQGEVSRDEIEAALGARWPLGRAVMRELIAQRVCSEKSGGFYHFPDLIARLAVVRCEYCGAELPLAGAESCPNCGGAVKTSVERVVAAKDNYRMDG